MDAVKFLQERNRMYESGAVTPCIGLEDDYNPVNAVKIIEEWAAAHPRKTRQSVFLEQWPNAELDTYDVLMVCPANLIGDEPENGELGCACSCADCRRGFWSKEVE